MTTDGLRDELARIAGDAPVADVDSGTWGRARRARTRDRVLGALGAVAAVALVSGLSTLGMTQRGDETPPATSSGGLAVPDQVYDVPAHLLERDVDESWSHGDVTDELDVGIGALAFFVYEGLPVVVGADDGDYHLLDLPGFVGNDPRIALRGQQLALTLSPDGRSLAYAAAELGPEPDATDVPTAIGVVDLDSGDVRRVTLPPGPDGRGVLVDRLVWSADSRWLAWHGVRITSWGLQANGDLDPRGAQIAGRVAPDATSVEIMDPVTTGQSGLSRSLGVDDTGVVVAAHGAELMRWDGGVLSRATTTEGDSLGQVVVPGDGRTVAAYHRTSGLRFVDTRTGRTVGRPADGRSSLPRAWIDDEVLGAVDNTLVRTGPGATRLAVRVDANVGAASVTVADDLLADGAPTVHRPEPRWPATWPELVARVGLAVGVLALGGLAVFLRRRPPSLLLNRAQRWFGGLVLGAVVTFGGGVAATFVVEDADHTGLRVGAVAALIALTALVGVFAGRSRAFWVGIVMGVPAGVLALFVALFVALVQSGALA